MITVFRLRQFNSCESSRPHNGMHSARMHAPTAYKANWTIACCIPAQTYARHRSCPYAHVQVHTMIAIHFNAIGKGNCRRTNWDEQLRNRYVVAQRVMDDYTWIGYSPIKNGTAKFQVCVDSSPARWRVCVCRRRRWWNNNNRNDGCWIRMQW